MQLQKLKEQLGNPASALYVLSVVKLRHNLHQILCIEKQKQNVNTIILRIKNNATAETFIILQE